MLPDIGVQRLLRFHFDQFRKIKSRVKRCFQVVAHGIIEGIQFIYFVGKNVVDYFQVLGCYFNFLLQKEKALLDNRQLLMARRLTVI